METHVAALRDEIDELRREIAELRASRVRLVLAADADRSAIERDLHEGLQQLLVALAVNLQLAAASTDAGPAAVSVALEELTRDVQQALEEATWLAQRIYPALLEAGGLAAALRAAAVSAGVTASVDVRATSVLPPPFSRTVYLCWLDVLGRPGGKERPTVTVREQDDALIFELLEPGSEQAPPSRDGLRDRIAALGGRLSVDSVPGGGTRLHGSMPLSGGVTPALPGTG